MLFGDGVDEKKLIINSTLDSKVDRDWEHPENSEQLNAFIELSLTPHSIEHNLL
jgi:hypothetical protein